MFPNHSTSLTLAISLTALALPACHGAPNAAGAPPAAPQATAQATEPALPKHRHHELHLPPPGPKVSVVFEGKAVDVALAELPHQGPSVPLLELWQAAVPNQDVTPLVFDLFGSDGFHPAARPPCARPLGAAEIARASIDVLTHDISFESGPELPGCYRVHGVVRFEAKRAALSGSASAAPRLSIAASAACVAADWTPRALPALLQPGKIATPSQPDRRSARFAVFDAQCTDSPTGSTQPSGGTTVIDGIEVRLVSAKPAGTSKRGWSGNQCAFELRLESGTGQPVSLGEQEIPPFNTITSLVRAGSAVWLSVSFNGYSKEFPQGGNRVIAADLCAGRVVWKSPDATSNGGLLLLGDYLISPYGFTNEPRSVFVLDARSGARIQKLPVIENVCPSKSWAPNWHAGERCDAPGQKVGAAVDPRVEAGLFFVDTNTGSATFQFK